MNEYISRDAVLAYPIRLNHYDKENGNAHFAYGVESVMEYVESLPAADVAPVVRCKDCIYFHENTEVSFGRCSRIDWFPYGGDFCSNGERRKGARKDAEVEE